MCGRCMTLNKNAVLKIMQKLQTCGVFAWSFKSLNSSQVKIEYEFLKPFRSKRFSKDENHAESEQFL